MAASGRRDPSKPQGLSAHLKGHIFLFEKRGAPAYGAAAGLRLLLIFVALEGILGPRLAFFGLLRLPIPPSWIRVPLQLGLALLAVRLIAGLKPAQIGFHPWRDWSRTEKSYFVQTVLLANLIFSIVLAARLGPMFEETSGWMSLGTVFLPLFLFGFYQEVMYRGILQTELMRRWGAPLGILVSNSLYTLGPLHFYHFSGTAPALPMFAAIFAIGLFFALLFKRSGNLWMVAIFHGIGNAYIVGTLRP